MTPQEYKQARKALGFTIQQAGQWLGVSSTTAQRYAQTGLPGPAARAVGIALAVAWLPRFNPAYPVTLSGVVEHPTGGLVRHSDLTAAVGL